MFHQITIRFSTDDSFLTPRLFITDEHVCYEQTVNKQTNRKQFRLNIFMDYSVPYFNNP